MSEKAKLHQVLAVEGELAGAAKKVMDEAIITFTKRAEHFGAWTKTYHPYVDRVENQQPPEFKSLDSTVIEKLEYMFGFVQKYWNANFQKEHTNQKAYADIIVNGKVLATHVPATVLLGLETKLKDVRKVLEVIPTLPPGIEWEKDLQKNQTGHVYKSTHADEKIRTGKQYKSKVLYEATDKHPAQIEKWEEQEPIGKYITERWSGTLTPAEKSVLLGNLDTLIRVVKEARQEANSTELENVNYAQNIINFILGN
jgi:hypothetical protein